jgi:hypothetical protein
MDYHKTRHLFDPAFGSFSQVNALKISIFPKAYRIDADIIAEKRKCCNIVS